MLPRILLWTFLLWLCGCAGTCQSFKVGCSNELGFNDWLIVQYPPNGDHPNCWVVKSKPLNGEELATYWIDDAGHIIHINVLHNIVQVKGGDFQGAAKALGVDLKTCLNGRGAK